MKKHIGLLLMLGLVMIFLLSGLVIISMEKSAPDPGVPMVGLTYQGKPCMDILVPDVLPKEFIEHADDIVVHRQQVNEYLANMAFVTSDGKEIITLWAAMECPKFIALDLYNMETEEERNWLWNPAGEFKEVTDEEYLVFMKALTPEIAQSYCPSQINKITFIAATELFPTVEIIQTWTKVEDFTAGCGMWFTYINPDSNSKYPIGYTHVCMNEGGIISQWGFMDRDGKIRHFYLNDFDQWERVPVPLPEIEKHIRDLLRKHRSRNEPI